MNEETEDAFETRDVIATAPDAPPPPFKPSPTIHSEMEARWSEPDVFAKTGMRGLDAMLHGGLRRGECVALAGSAGHGKSSLAIQLALEAARSGGVAIYCTAEMAPDEILARATARTASTTAPAASRAARTLPGDRTVSASSWRKPLSGAAASRRATWSAG